MARTAISLFIDDTHIWPQGAVAELIDFCEAEGVRGKISLIPGMRVAPGESHLGLREGADARAYMAEMARAGERGLDVHMELMTHQNLWDFSIGAVRPDGPHEGIWLHEPGVPVAEYEGYFEGVLAAARAGGATINGVTVPGCGCDTCQARMAALKAEGRWSISDNAWEALLNVAERGGFGVPAVAVFIDEIGFRHRSRMVAERGDVGVFDARADVFDVRVLRFKKLNLRNLDNFITEEGGRGRIAEAVRTGAERSFFCLHWTQINPANTEGWAAFRELVRRINDTLGERVEWVKPSEYGARLMRA